MFLGAKCGDLSLAHSGAVLFKQKELTGYFCTCWGLRGRGRVIALQPQRQHVKRHCQRCWHVKAVSTPELQAVERRKESAFKLGDDHAPLSAGPRVSRPQLRTHDQVLRICRNPA